MSSRSGIETNGTCNDMKSEGHRVVVHVRVGPLSGEPREPHSGGVRVLHSCSFVTTSGGSVCLWWRSEVPHSGGVAG